MSFFEFPHTRTYDGDLGWLIKHVSSYDEVIQALNTWIEENTPKIEDLETFKNALENGQLPEGVKQGLYDWCSRHLLDLVGSTIKSVMLKSVLSLTTLQGLQTPLITSLGEMLTMLPQVLRLFREISTVQLKQP